MIKFNQCGEIFQSTIFVIRNRIPVFEITKQAKEAITAWVVYAGLSELDNALGMAE